MSRLVIDASALFPIALTGAVPGPLQAYELVGPPLLWSETVSALREAEWRGVLESAQAVAAIGRIHRLGVTRVDDDGLAASAYEVARKLGWAKTYDAEYVALAQRLGVALFTRDLRLRRAASALISFYDPA